MAPNLLNWYARIDEDTSLEIFAKVDALVLYSLIPLIVNSYLDRLDNMAFEFVGHHLSAHSPDLFESQGNHLWTYKVSCVSSL